MIAIDGSAAIAFNSSVKMMNKFDKGSGLLGIACSVWVLAATDSPSARAGFRASARKKYIQKIRGSF